MAEPEPKKLYTLPDLQPAPYSDLQALVRRLVETADWSVLPALLDELQEKGRRDDAVQFGAMLTRHAVPIVPPYSDLNNWTYMAEGIVGLFLFDLFSVEAVTGVLSRIEWKSAEEISRELQGIIGASPHSRRVLPLPVQTQPTGLEHYP